MSTIPVNATAHLLQHSSRVPDLAVAARRYTRDDQRIAPKFAMHCMEELVVPLLMKSVAEETYVSIGADAYFVIESTTPAILSDLQHHLASRMMLGRCATIAKFREPSQGIPELLDSLNGLTSMLDTDGFMCDIVAVTAPTLATPKLDELNPNEAIDDTQFFVCQIDDIVRAPLLKFSIARNEPAGVPWPDHVLRAINHAMGKLQYVAYNGPILGLRYRIATSLLKELRQIVNKPRSYSVGVSDSGKVCIGYHPAFPQPVLAVLDDNGVVTSVHERSRFPQVNDGDLVNLRY